MMHNKKKNQYKGAALTIWPQRQKVPLAGLEPANLRLDCARVNVALAQPHQTVAEEK
jgi:hypothetical protein